MCTMYYLTNYPFKCKYKSIEGLCTSVLSEGESLTSRPIYVESHTAKQLSVSASDYPGIMASNPVAQEPPFHSVAQEPPFTITDAYIDKVICDNIEGQVLEEIKSSSEYQQSTDKFIYYDQHEYAFGKFKKKPKTFPDRLTPVVEKVQQHSSKGKDVNACLINVYEDGNAFVQPHADNELSLSPWGLILTISIGVDRAMKFSCGDSILTQTLKSGRLLIKTRVMQNSWKHSIDADPGLSGCIISLSFRHIDHIFANSTIVVGDCNTKKLNFG